MIYIIPSRVFVNCLKIYGFIKTTKPSVQFVTDYNWILYQFAENIGPLSEAIAARNSSELTEALKMTFISSLICLIRQ